MRAPQLVTDFFEWRWAPCVGLTAGSLAFVGFAVLLIPTRIGGEPRAVNTLSSYESPPAQRAIFSSSLARKSDETEEHHESERLARAVPRVAAAIAVPNRPLQRGFSPILERAEPLAAPTPVPSPAPPPPVPPQPVASQTAPAQAETPPPAPSSVVVQPEAGGPARESTQ